MQKTSHQEKLLNCIEGLIELLLVINVMEKPEDVIESYEKNSPFRIGS